jgi:hypothetical protein
MLGRTAVRLSEMRGIVAGCPEQAGTIPADIP